MSRSIGTRGPHDAPEERECEDCAEARAVLADERNCLLGSSAAEPPEEE